MTSLTAALPAATDRLLATARSLSEADWAAPSLCAGWSRSHVLAHLALNAEGLAGVLRGIRDGRPTTMYASDEARDGDIDALAAEAPAVVLDRLVAGCAALADVAAVADGLAPGTTFERTPGGRSMPADAVPSLRLREVEIHHADLDAGYGPADWPRPTAVAFLGDDARRYEGPGFHVTATDEPARWAFGSPAADAPTVSGPVGALAWWASGRQPSADVASSTGTLPSLEGR
ncbi:maleylpyruvate isomerase family mycothiol-dependent enzyme [Nocardioides sp. R1-1]|uniref:maleylpyruvate isomerase family mycothiol-dependent enzyme n=1 Tax=Nocardioides sp. R1-1 TaxID=3383502 RepID=UPI0038D02D9A